MANLNPLSLRGIACAFVLGLFLLGKAGANEPLGLRVDVGGYKLFIHCLGKGRPTVILDAGLGGSSRDWGRVQQGLAAVTQVCVYDRAGYGNSDPGPFPRTSSRIVTELHTLLGRTSLSPPYLLVGHSFGGYNMRLYASRYPHEAAALVLVDTPHEEQLNGFLQSQFMRQIDSQGLLRSLGPELLANLASVDLEPFAYLFGLQSKTLRAILGELAAFEQSGEELGTAKLDPALPLVVIVHGKRVLPEGPLSKQMEQQWLALQRDLAARQKNGTFLIAKDSAHAIPLDQPELIVAAVQRLLVTRR